MKIKFIILKHTQEGLILYKNGSEWEKSIRHSETYDTYDLCQSLIESQITDRESTDFFQIEKIFVKS